MNRRSVMTKGLLLLAVAATGCATLTPGPAWVTLIDGDRGLENFDRLGDAPWRAEGGAIVAEKGKAGYLVTRQSYRDFEIYAEFYAETDTNSGIFMRISDPKKIGAETSYEVNIWDIRPDPIYATGAIVNFAAVPVPTVHKAGGKWNTFHITAKGPHLTVKFNGVETVNIRNDKFASGPFALQYGGGVKGAVGGPIKWRKVQVRPL